MWPIAFVEGDICQPMVDFDPLKYHVWVPLYTHLFFHQTLFFIYHWKVCFGEVKLSERAVCFGRLCFKHCQRHNGPEGWVVAPNQPLFVAQHIDQNSAQLQNLQHMSTSTYWPNSSFETSTKLQPPNLDQTFCSKSDQNFSLKNSTKL